MKRSKKNIRDKNKKIVFFVFIVLLTLILPLTLIALKKVQQANLEAKQKLPIESQPNIEEMSTAQVNPKLDLLKKIQSKTSKGEQTPTAQKQLLPEENSNNENYHLVKYWQTQDNLISMTDTKIVDGDIFVHDYPKRIHRYTFSGQHVSTWQFEDPTYGVYSMSVDDEFIYLVNYNESKVAQYSLDGALIRELGGEGSEPGQLLHPFDLAYEKNTQTLLVTDTDNNRIEVFDKFGNYVRTIGEFGEGSGQFISPTHILIKDNKIYVADYANGGRIQVLTLEGEWIKTIPIQGAFDMWARPYDESLLVHYIDQRELTLYDRDDNIQQTIFTTGGTEIDEINWIGGILFDNDNLMYVADNKTMKIFSLHGSEPTYNLVSELKIKDENGERSLKEWYQEVMGTAVPIDANYEWFGAWKTLSLKNSLYLLLGTGRPAELNGAALVKTQLISRDTLQPYLISIQNRQTDVGNNLWYMEEDGVLDMDAFGNEESVLIPGVDPGYSDNWSGGNAYTYSTKNNLLTKIRCVTAQPQFGDCGTDNHVFPGVIHSYASTVVNDSILFVGASEFQDDPYYPTKGVIYKSRDGGVTWQKTAALSLDSYRVYDINAVSPPSSSSRSTRVTLFATTYPRTLITSSGTYETVGYEWQNYTPAGSMSINYRIKSVVVGNKYYFVGDGGKNLGIVTVNPDGSSSFQRKPFVQFLMGTTSQYTYAILVGTPNALYAVSDGKYIYKGDLNGENWRRVADLRDYPSVQSLSYWPAQNKLVAVTKGENAQILLIPTNDPL